jgi:hypothetical protein
MEFWKTAVPAILSPVNHYSIRAILAVAVALAVALALALALALAVAVAVARIEAGTEAGTEAFQNLHGEALENHDFCAYAS